MKIFCKRSILFLAFGCLLFLFNSCRKIIPEVETDIQFLGHKGGGNNTYSELYIENTLPSIQYAMKFLDGVEVDLYMSKDGTIYMYHNQDISDYNCATTTKEEYIPLLTDNEIDAIKLCYKDRKDRIYRLKELIDYWNSTPSGFYISLEIKYGYHPYFEEIGGRSAYLLRMATSLASTIDKLNHKNKLFLEVESKALINELKLHETTKDIKCLLINSSPILERIKSAKDNGYDGISADYSEFGMNEQTVKKAHDLGLYVMLWTPYYKSEIVETFNMKPDAIQTDNMDAKRYLNVK